VSWLGDLGSAILGALYAQRVAAAVVGTAVAIAFAVLAWRRGWIVAARRHPGRSVAVLAPALAVALPLGWYLGSPLILSSSIDEPAPTAVAASARPGASGSTPPVTASPRLATETPAVTPSASSPAAPRELAGTFHGSDDFHFGEGTARLIETSPDTWVVRLEDFAVRNGPDLYVYLSPSADGYAPGAIEIGRLKADRGNQNYAVPAGILDDPDGVASVVIWCKQFSHLFATAPLAAA